MHPSTKFRPPVAGSRTIVRDELIGLLQGGPHAAVVVRAPAGYGKTTAITHWLDSSDRNRIWVALDEDDDDPAGLWGALGEAAARVGLRTHDAPDPTDAGAVRSTAILPLIESLDADGSPWVIVLDDVHLVRSDDTMASLDWFLRRMPQNVTVVLITRTPLDLPALRRLRSRGEVLDLSPNALRLDKARMRQLLQSSFGLSLTASDLDEVDDATGGWPAAVALVGAALSRGTPLPLLLSQRLDDEAGVRALIDEGLTGSAPQDADLLRRMSIFDRFTAEILAGVLRDERAWGVAMDVAERTGLIASLDDEGRWWRMHHLVREQLRAELNRTDPALRRELHRRALSLPDTQNDLPTAMHHLLGSESWDTIADLLINGNAVFTIPRQDLEMSWLDRIPQTVLETDPRLAFWEAWSAGASGERDRQERALARGRVASSGRGFEAFASWDDATDFVHAFSCYDDIGGALRAGERFLAKPYRDTPWEQAVQTCYAMMLYLAGRCESALQVLDDIDDGRDLLRPVRLYLPSYRALSLMELGEWERAAQAVEEAQQVRTVFGFGMEHLYLPSEHALARYQTESGDPAAGLATAAHCLEIAQHHGDAFFIVPHLLLEAARADFALGRRADAIVALNQAEQLSDGARDPGGLPERIARMRARFGVDRPPGGPVEQLSRRELEVLALLPSELSASEIASELFISPNTARTHIKSIHRKLGASSRGEAVVNARAAGLILAATPQIT